MKFNHEAESLTEALGIKLTDVELTNLTFSAITSWLDKPDGGTKSELAEEIHKALPYDVILLLATREIHNTLSESLNESSPIERLLETLERVIRKSDDRISSN